MENQCSENVGMINLALVRTGVSTPFGVPRKKFGPLSRKYYRKLHFVAGDTFLG